jgi:selenocysteine lyase/cysteine desulfurase
LTYKHLFRRFLEAVPGRLHFAAHSHHPWPDVTYEAHARYWDDSARMMDDKWGMIFGRVIPEARLRLAPLLGVRDPGTLVFAPNTHELLTRLFSCLQPPVRIVTSDAEFHSFARQSRRWEEEGLATVVRVPAEPFASFPARMVEASGSADLLYLSQVFFDSGYVTSDLEAIVHAAPAGALVVIDGYHGFMALPTDIAAVADRAFYLAGGYKYAMSGEGVAFMHCPPGYALRPVDTGWFASFDALTEAGSNVTYPEGGDRFWGATFDPSGIYRLIAVLRLLEAEAITPVSIHAQATALQNHFLDGRSLPGELVPPAGNARGNFLTFQTGRAEDIYRSLHARGIITDFRGNRFRIGFGIYQDAEDVARLVEALGRR